MIKCISPYRSSLGSYKPGDVIDEEELCDALLRDSPGSFELVEEEQEVKALDTPPIDKMMKRSTRKADVDE